MRYAFGILFGATLTAIIFAEFAAIKVAGFGVSDPNLLASLWGLYLVWVAVSVILILAPPIVVVIANREMLRELLLYEAGGLALFTPIWFSIATEVSGGSWIGTLLNGIEDGIPVVGEGWRIVGADVGPMILIPSFLVLLIIGIVFLRPSFLKKATSPPEPRELTALKERPVSETEAIEAEMPGVAPPVPDEKSVSELKSLLTQIGTPDAVVKAILDAGIATVTDLVATSPDQLVSMTGIDRRTAENLQTAAQKKVWFGGI